MDLTAQTTSTTASAGLVVPAVKARRTSLASRVGRVLGLSLLVAMISVGATVATPSPVAAASGVTACFKWDTGAAYATQPIYLMKWSSSTRKWVSVRSGKTNSRGCGTFSSVPTTTYTMVQAYRVFGDANVGLAIYNGYSPLMANPGSGSVGLGTGIVRLVQCTWGLYDYCAGMV